LPELFDRIELNVDAHTFVAKPNSKIQPIDSPVSIFDIRIRNPHRIAIFKSIKRQIAKRLKSQGHRKCLHMALFKLRHPHEMSERQNPSDEVILGFWCCPVGHAFNLWRSSFEARDTCPYPKGQSKKQSNDQCTGGKIDRQYRRNSFDRFDDDRHWAWITMNSYYAKCAALKFFTLNVLRRIPGAYRPPDYREYEDIMNVPLNVNYPPFGRESFMTCSNNYPNDGNLTAFGFSMNEESTLIKIEASFPADQQCNKLPYIGHLDFYDRPSKWGKPKIRSSPVEEQDESSTESDLSFYSKVGRWLSGLRPVEKEDQLKIEYALTYISDMKILLSKKS